MIQLILTSYCPFNFTKYNKFVNWCDAGLQRSEKKNINIYQGAIQSKKWGKFPNLGVQRKPSGGRSRPKESEI